MEENLRCPLSTWLSGKESACQCRRLGFYPRVRKIPWRRKWQSTPVSLPGESHGQRSLACCSLWGRKESDTTNRLSTAHTFLHSIFLSSPTRKQPLSGVFCGQVGLGNSSRNMPLGEMHINTFDTLRSVVKKSPCVYLTQDFPN